MEPKCHRFKESRNMWMTFYAETFKTLSLSEGHLSDKNILE